MKIEISISDWDKLVVDSNCDGECTVKIDEYCQYGYQGSIALEDETVTSIIDVLNSRNAAIEKVNSILDIIRNCWRSI